MGGSGIERIIECPGSVQLSFGVEDEEDDSYSKSGAAAHALGEYCLNNHCDAWEFIHWVVLPDGSLETARSTKDLSSGLIVDKEMADAVQVYLDAVREAHPDRHQGNFFVERRFHVPSLHRYFYGTSDAVYIDEANRTLHVWDYKHGAGIVVEVENNAQCKYYACGVLADLNIWSQIDKVVLHIVQPRAWLDPKHREWEIGIGDLEDWLDQTLILAMDRALVSNETKTGEHCRFCPARARACPALMADVDELEKLMEQFNLSEKGQAAKLTSEQLARMLNLGETFKIAQKAALGTAYLRLQMGAKIPGWKLAAQKANRIFKEGAQAAAEAVFGKRCYSKPELLSPAQIEKLPAGDAFCKEWAFKPDTGLTVVKADDVRPAVSRDTKSGFEPVKKGKK
jgi:hypothetical protein